MDTVEFSVHKNNKNCPGDGKKLCNMYTKIRKNLGEPGGFYVKWNQPDTERQIWSDLTYMWNLKYIS